MAAVTSFPLQDAALRGLIDTGLKEPPAFDRQHFQDLLLWATDHEVSDITIQAGNYVFVERHGRLAPVTRRRWSAAEAYQCAQEIYGANADSQLGNGEDIDCSYEIRRGRQDLARYRINLVAARAPLERGLEITVRTIPTTPPTLASLALPPALLDHLVFEQGLVVITGPTGSGKTTLLAAIVRSLLEDPESHRKIITYEWPIEYVYDFVARFHAVISQHEMGGVHLRDFAAAVRNSLRRNPNVILLGEARDAETIDAMIQAAQTGHLVYTTSHTNSVPETLPRLLEPFPAHERDSRLAALLGALRCIVTQRLVRTTDGRRAPVREFLHFRPALKDRLLATDVKNIVPLTQDFVRRFGQPLTDDLHALLKAGRLSDTEWRNYREVGTQRASVDDVGAPAPRADPPASPPTGAGDV